MRELVERRMKEYEEQITQLSGAAETPRRQGWMEDRRIRVCKHVVTELTLKYPQQQEQGKRQRKPKDLIEQKSVGEREKIQK